MATATATAKPAKGSKPAATKTPPAPRTVLEKADPAEVAAYFASTGLTRKQIAGAAGVSTSVISTVQNPKGDRWSVKTFTAKRVLIDAEAARLSAMAAEAAAVAASEAEAESEEQVLVPA